MATVGGITMTRRRLAAVLVGICAMTGGALAAAPGAAANSFGGYTFAVGTNILGERVSLRSPGSMVVGAGNFVLYRAVLQVAGGGLIQTGII
jgi:hypothetical protein